MSDLGLYQLVLSLTAILSFTFNGVRSDFIRFKFNQPFQSDIRFYLPISKTEVGTFTIIHIIIVISILQFYNFSYYLLVVTHALLYSIYLINFAQLSVTDKNYLKTISSGLLSLMFLVTCVILNNYTLEVVVIARCFSIVILILIIAYVLRSKFFFHRIKSPLKSYNEFYNKNYINNFGNIIENQSDKVLLGYASSTLL